MKQLEIERIALNWQSRRQWTKALRICKDSNNISFNTNIALNILSLYYDSWWRYGYMIKEIEVLDINAILDRYINNGCHVAIETFLGGYVYDKKIIPPNTTIVTEIPPYYAIDERISKTVLKRIVIRFPYCRYIIEHVLPKVRDIITEEDRIGIKKRILRLSQPHYILDGMNLFEYNISVTEWKRLIKREMRRHIKIFDKNPQCYSVSNNIFISLIDMIDRVVVVIDDKEGKDNETFMMLLKFIKGGGDNVSIERMRMGLLLL